MARGAFITFEGGEGAGKSTQTRILAQRLRARGRTVLVTREPGGSPFAERLRTALLSDRGRALGPDEQAILFAAARADHVASVIAPALEAGDWVISDRFFDSTAAYQGAAGAPEALLDLLRRLAVGSLVPDLTIVLDVAPEVGLARAQGRASLDAFERDDVAVHAARREAFLAIAAREPQRCVVLDASSPPEPLAEAVWRTVAGRLLAIEPAA